MHWRAAVKGGAADGSAAALSIEDRQTIVQQAAQWLVLLHGQGLSTRQQQELQAWRQRSTEHERAWQAAQQLRQALGQLPQGVGQQVLTQAGRQRRAALRSVAGLAGVAMAAPLVWQLWEVLGVPYTADLHTAVGERRTLALADGSRLWLNTGTAVDLHFDGLQRRLVLHAGELFIDAVASALPLAVQVAAGRVRAHPDGQRARFGVRAMPGKRWRVGVEQGQVLVLPARERALLLTAGQHTQFDAQGAEPASPLEAGQDALAWREGVVVARDMRLGDLVAELARYRPGVLQCAPEVAQLRISGVFQIEDTERSLQALAEALPIVVRQRTRYWVTLLPSDARSQ